MAQAAAKAVMDECRRASWLNQLARRPRSRPHVLPLLAKMMAALKSSPQRRGCRSSEAGGAARSTNYTLHTTI